MPSLVGSEMFIRDSVKTSSAESIALIEPSLDYGEVLQKSGHAWDIKQLSCFERNW